MSHPLRLVPILVGLATSLALAGEPPPAGSEAQQTVHHHHAHGHHDHVDDTPIGLMGAHEHGPGEVMLSYRFGYMVMDGNRSGTDRLSKSDVYNRGYMVAPTEMTMEMHMLGAMYAPIDRLTLAAMIPYKRYAMDHVVRMSGRRFTTTSEGFGDLKLAGILRVAEWDAHSILLDLGFSAPTGRVDERDDTPAGPDQKLPYPMQLGSGTFDLLPGLVYTGRADRWSWGTQALAVWRLGRNEEGYSLGDRYTFSGWLARSWTEWISTSLRAEGVVLLNIDGADSDLNPMMVPTADPNLRGGERIDILFGVSVAPFRPFSVPAWVENQRLAVEFGLPIYQRLDGPQLEVDWRLVAGWQWAF